MSAMSARRHLNESEASRVVGKSESKHKLTSQKPLEFHKVWYPGSGTDLWILEMQAEDQSKVGDVQQRPLKIII